MTDTIAAAFEPVIYTIPLTDVLPSRKVTSEERQTVKYKTIAASIAEVGLVEPLMIAPRTPKQPCLLLDGHLRLDALREAGMASARCMVAMEDESFTYNKRVSRLPSIQEHRMIVRAVERGVSEERLARALNLDVKAIRQRRNLLVGISDDFVELMKDKPIGETALTSIRKMKPMRQLEVAELMISANNYSATYARALLATTRNADLHKPERKAKATGMTPEQMDRLEREMNAVQADYKSLEATYGDDVLVLVVASGFIQRVISKPEIERFLASRYPEILEQFRSIVAATSLDSPSLAA